MKYPKLDEVEKASPEQLLRWHRFLDSPGMSAIGKRSPLSFEDTMVAESHIINRIMQRLKEAGGITPEISKAVGWQSPSTTNHNAHAL